MNKVMEELRKVEYYVSDKYDPDVGFQDEDEEDEEDNRTAIGLFHRFADSYFINNNTIYPLTIAIIEDEATGEILHREPKQLSRFIK